jgi:hypothetical protein
VSAWALVALVVSAAAVGPLPRAGEESDRKETVCEAWPFDPGVPAGTQLYLAEVNPPPDAPANRRWAVTAGGEVLFSSNAPPFDHTQLARQPFNRPFLADPIARLEPADVARLLEWLETNGFFTGPSEVRPPDDVDVSGGPSRYVMARRAPDATATCVRFHSGAPAGDELKALFARLIEARLRPRD